MSAQDIAVTLAEDKVENPVVHDDVVPAEATSKESTTLKEIFKQGRAVLAAEAEAKEKAAALAQAVPQRRDAWKAADEDISDDEGWDIDEYASTGSDTEREIRTLVDNGDATFSAVPREEETEDEAYAREMKTWVRKMRRQIDVAADQILKFESEFEDTHDALKEPAKWTFFRGFFKEVKKVMSSACKSYLGSYSMLDKSLVWTCFVKHFSPMWRYVRYDSWTHPTELREKLADLVDDGEFLKDVKTFRRERCVRRMFDSLWEWVNDHGFGATWKKEQRINLDDDE